MSKNINIEELKSLQLQILDDIHTFCIKHKLRYFLAYGTLIGALRHQGYIPWDDDIDIMMPRPDYDKFIELYNQKDSPFRIVCLENNNDYDLPFGKVHDSRTLMVESMYNSKPTYGVYIDLFPLDGYSDAKTVLKAQRLRNILNVKKAKLGKGRGFIKDCAIFFAKIMLIGTSVRKILLKMNKLARKEKYETADRVGYITCLGRGESNIFPKKYFSNTILSAFEGREYCIPSNSHEILTSIYGDYMQVPNEEERISTHTFKAWWR